jgi:hypothetical protein
MRRVIPFSVLTALSVCPSLGAASDCATPTQREPERLAVIAEAEPLITELEADVAETERLMIEVRVKLTASKSAGS